VVAAIFITSSNHFTSQGVLVPSPEEAELPAAGHAGDLYSKLLGDLVAQEAIRKASIEQRGLAVITTAGGLISLLVALSALLLGKNSTATLGWEARGLLIAAIVAFIVAASLGLAANTPRWYEGLNTSDLDRMVAQHSWLADKDEAALLIAEEHVRELKVGRKLNNRKAAYLQRAIITEVIGVGLVAAAIVVALSA
jgi:hypothetical protein